MGLREEIKQSKPFASPKQEVVLNLHRTSEFFHQQMTAVLKPHKLSISQYNMLRILKGAGPEGHSCKEAANRMVKKDPDITRLFDRMEARGLVERDRDDTDRRVVHSRITQKGIALLDEIGPDLKKIMGSLLKNIRPEEFPVFIDLLERARAENPRK